MSEQTRWVKRTMLDVDTEASTEVMVPNDVLSIRVTVAQLSRFLVEAGYVPEAVDE